MASKLESLRKADPEVFGQSFVRKVQTPRQPIILAEAPPAQLVKEGRALFYRGHWYGSDSVKRPYVWLRKNSNGILMPCLFMKNYQFSNKGTWISQGGTWSPPITPSPHNPSVGTQAPK